MNGAILKLDRSLISGFTKFIVAQVPRSENRMADALTMSRPESRSDPIGGSEPVSGTRDSGLGLLNLIFFLKAELYLWVWPTSYNLIKYFIHITESHLQIQNFTFTLQIRARNLHVVNPYKCVGPAVCGCLLMSSPVPTRIKNPC